MQMSNENSRKPLNESQEEEQRFLAFNEVKREQLLRNVNAGKISHL
jgi:hypothetical protein